MLKIHRIYRHLVQKGLGHWYPGPRSPWDPSFDYRLTIIIAMFLVVMTLACYATGPTPTAPSVEATVVTIIPTLTSIPSLYDSAAVISPENIAQMTRLVCLDVDKVENIAWTPDGQTILVSGNQGIVLYDAVTLNKTRTIPTSGAMAFFSPDGRLAAWANQDKTISLLDIATGEVLYTLAGHTAFVDIIAISPDGKVCVSSDITPLNPVIELWNIETGREYYALYGHFQKVGGLAFSPNSAVLASGDRGANVRLWDVATGRELSLLRGYYHADVVVFSPDGRLVAWGGISRKVELWDWAAGQKRHILIEHTEPLNDIVFSPDSKIVATGSADKTIKLWDVETGRELISLKGHTAGVNGVAFAPNARLLASVSHDNTMCLWGIK